jgi:hypothetical protein
MGRITFSNDSGKASEKDITKTVNLAEGYFHTAKDKTQLRTNKANFTWVYGHYPHCLNVIKSDGKVIGFTLVLPCNKKIMTDFLRNKINERRLLERVKKEITPGNFETLYLCACYVDERFRRKGLAKRGFIGSVKRLGKKDLFYWAYSAEGGKLVRRVARELKLRIYKRD